MIPRYTRPELAEIWSEEQRYALWTRIELANAIFEYLEVFHNRQRRHTALGMRTPIEYERIHHNNLTIAPASQAS